ncbi:MAG: hypothetical protein L6435_00230 [Anaerolineae bacterium]|nr:hypothetical protein [Anaerolineae bacterium]
MSFKNQGLPYRVALVMLGLLSIIVLTRPMSGAVWQRTIGKPGPLAAGPQSDGARIEIDATQRIGPVNKLLFGNYVIAPGAGSAIVDTDSQFSTDALQMIQELQPSILRLGDLPIFEDSIGDPRTRPAARCGWEWWHTYEYGVDEHMALLEAIGAEGQALITVGYPDALVDSSDPDSCIISSIDSNLSQMVKRAMAWVAYVNGDPADATLIGLDDQGFDWHTVGYWAQRRAGNGHPEPYGVKYWEIGNEIYFHPDEISPEKYGQDYIAFRDAMKQVDPSITVGASATLASVVRHSTWNIPLLRVIGSNVDALVVHPYYPVKSFDASKAPAVMAGSIECDSDLSEFHDLLASTGRADEIVILVGEMGVDFDYRTEETEPISWAMLLAALQTADIKGLLVQRSADLHLELGIQHWLHGGASSCDIYLDWDTRERYKRPDYYALQMWTNHFGDVLVRNAVVCDTYDVDYGYGNTGPLYDVPYLAAHTSVAGDKLYLLVINRHLADDITTTIRINGFTPQGSAEVYTLNGASFESHNEYGNHDTVAITSFGLTGVSQEFEYTFPAHSVTAVELVRAAD